HLSNKLKDDGLNGATRLGIMEFRDEIRKVVAGGKIVEEKVKIQVLKPVPVFIADKAILLEPFNEKQVKIVGKLVPKEVAGRKYDEILPATIEIFEPKQSGASPAKQDDACCGDDKDTPVKIIAKARWPYVSTDPKSDKQGKQLLIRSAAELVANSPYKESDARQDLLEQKATEEIAKLLNVKGIDWKTQMLVVVTGGVKNTGGWKIDIVGVTVADKTLTVHWLLSPPPGVATQAFTHPSLMALVERTGGEARFVLTPADKVNLPK